MTASTLIFLPIEQGRTGHCNCPSRCLYENRQSSFKTTSRSVSPLCPQRRRYRNRNAGSEKLADMRNGADNGETMEGKINVESLIPVLDVRDVDTSVAFYCDVLGFTLQDKVEWAGRTEWALLKTGKVQLMLCASQDDLDDEDHNINEGIFFLHLENPDAVILEMKNRGLHRNVKPESQLGSKDFYLRDPDGYILWFSHRPPVTDRSAVEEETAVRKKKSTAKPAPAPQPDSAEPPPATTVQPGMGSNSFGQTGANVYSNRAISNNSNSRQTRH